MTTFGYTLSSEEHPPLELVRYARMAEEADFSYASISDHFHPWTSSQGQSPFVWSVAAATEHIGLGIGVTCPLIRIHPAIVAHASATATALMPGRFFLGVGTGEALNEHILGDRWPPPGVRIEMLEEAIDVIRRLWQGDTVDHHGRHYTVENARLFTVPDEPPPLIVSAFGDTAMELAGRIGDGYWGTSPDKEKVDAYAEAGGTGPRYGQVTLCWAEDAAAARKLAHEVWPNTAIKGQLSQDLPTWTHFEQAAGMVTEDDVAETTPCGPDVGPVLELVQEYVDAGYTHLHFHQIGPDQEGFFRFWQEELSPALG